MAGFILTAGCLGAPEEGDPGPEGPEADPREDVPQGTAPPEGEEGGLSGDTGSHGPPSWHEGDWFTWAVDSGPARMEATTVVTEVGPRSARVGFADLENGILAQWFHLPPAGAMGIDALSWEVHDEPSSLVQFPLHDGASWQAAFEGEELEFQAVAIPDPAETLFTITGAYASGEAAVRAVYSVEIGQFASIELLYGGSEPWAAATLTDHGSGYSGAVHVLEGDDLFVGASAPPTFLREPQTVHIPEGATHVLLGCDLGGLAGAYRVQLDGPSGQSIRCDYQATQTEWTSDTQIRHSQAEPGDWVLTLLPGSARGFVFAEVVALTVTATVAG